LATDSNEADEIRHRMAQLRSELHHDMRGVVAGAKDATDWRSYIRKRPWLAIGVAFAAGYLVVPRRSTVVVRTAEPVAFEPAAQVPMARAKEPARGSTLGWLLRLAAPVLTRVAQGYVLNTIESMLVNNPPHRAPTGSWPEHAAGQRANFDRRDYSGRL
jgi:hypothetical protein